MMEMRECVSFDKCPDCKVSNKVEPLFHMHFSLEDEKLNLNEFSTLVNQYYLSEKNITVVVFKSETDEELLPIDDKSGIALQVVFPNSVDCTENGDSLNDLYENPVLFFKEEVGDEDEDDIKFTDVLKESVSEDIIVKNNGEKEKIFQCSVCPKKFASMKNLKRHTCRTEKKYKSEETEKKGKLIAEKNGTFSCTECHSEYKHYYNAARHVEIHLGMKKRHQCDRCERTFSTKDSLNRHIASLFCENETPFGFSSEPEGFSDWPTKERDYYIQSLTAGYCLVCDEFKNDPFQPKKHWRTKFKLHFRIWHTNKTIMSLQTGLLDCKLCDVTFSQEDEVLKHSKDIHGECKPFKCNECDTSFDEYIMFEAHLAKIHKEGGAYYCNNCPRSFSKYQGIIQHLIKDHEKRAPASLQERLSKNKLPCTICGLLIHKTKMKRHFKMTHDQTKIEKSERIPCELCGKLVSQQNVTVHMNRHKKIKEFKCRFCEKSFSTNTELNKHRINYHEEKANFECELCGDTFKTPDLKRLHKKKIHELLNIPCNICGKIYDDSTKLRDHFVVCSKTTEHVCPYENCNNKYYPQKCYLTRHINAVHLNIKPFSCDQCDKQFKRSQDLLGHIRNVHTGEKPFECETCGKAFSIYKGWKKHQQVHSSLKQFKCECCNKAFSQKCNLTVHVKEQHSESGLSIIMSKDAAQAIN